MPKLDVTLDRWLPDLLPFAMLKGGLVTCKNIMPLEEKFANMPRPIAYSTNAVTGTPLSSVEYYADNGIFYTFIGTTTKLYRMETNKSLTDVTRTSGDYTTSGNRWYFAKYGNWIIATNFNDEVQVLKGMTAANFEPLYTTETIKAKYIVQNHGHLLLFYVIRNGVTYPNGVIISAKDTINDVVKSIATGADFVNLEESPTQITGANVFEFASAAYESNIAITHRNSISVCWYAGGQYIFNFDYNRYLEIGALEGSFVMVNGIAYFFDEKTFYRWDGINKPEDIGLGVRNTILNFLDIASYYRITAASHPRYGLAVWSIVKTSGSGNPDYILILNTRNNKFSLIELTQYCVFSMHRNAWTIDAMGDFFPKINEIPYPVNSNYWQDTSAIFGCIGTDLKVNVFQGVAMNWKIETGDISTPDLEIIRSKRTHPIIANNISPVTVSIGSRMEESDAVVYTSTSVASNGYADIRAFGRYMRIALEGGAHGGLHSIDVKGDIIGRK